MDGSCETVATSTFVTNSYQRLPLVCDIMYFSSAVICVLFLIFVNQIWMSVLAVQLTAQIDSSS